MTNKKYLELLYSFKYLKNDEQLFSVSNLMVSLATLLPKEIYKEL